MILLVNKLTESAMPRARKTWTEKMKAKPPHHVILEKDFAGIPKGSKLHISCPVEVVEELKDIAPGSIISIQAFRRRLAEKNNCDATCPVSTSIFQNRCRAHLGRVPPNRQHRRSCTVLASCGVKFTYGKET